MFIILKYLNEIQYTKISLSDIQKMSAPQNFGLWEANMIVIQIYDKEDLDSVTILILMSAVSPLLRMV